MPRPAKRSSILPIATTGSRAAVSAIEQRLAGRRQRVVVAVRGAREAPGRADERPRDDAADAEPLADQLVGDLAGAIQLGDRHDLFVRGDLEDAVGRRVDDQRAGAHVLGAELVDDLGAGRGLVAEHAAAGAARELGDDLRRKPVRETSGTGGRARCPSSPSGRSPSPCPADASAIRPNAPPARDRSAASAADASTTRSRPSARSVGSCSGTCARDVAERVAALVAVDAARRAARRCRRCRGR